MPQGNYIKEKNVLLTLFMQPPCGGLPRVVPQPQVHSEPYRNAYVTSKSSTELENLTKLPA
jgi:hypothetical protein